jgi:hypothetical protein
LRFDEIISHHLLRELRDEVLLSQWLIFDLGQRCEPPKEVAVLLTGALKAMLYFFDLPFCDGNGTHGSDGHGDKVPTIEIGKRLNGGALAQRRFWRLALFGRGSPSQSRARLKSGFICCGYRFRLVMEGQI